MDECSRCGVSEDDETLFEVITRDGINLFCSECLKQADAPLLKRPTSDQLKHAENPSSVYERLSSMAGLNAQAHYNKFRPGEVRKRESLKKEEASLRNLVDKKYQEKIAASKTPEAKPRPDLVDNFHWVIMRARRMNKLSPAQMAEKIAESEAAIKLAEQGILPENDYKLVNKIESFLRVKLIKDDVRKRLSERSKKLDFDDVTSKNLTIADLKEMKEKTEIGNVFEDEEEIPVPEFEEELVLNEDLAGEEVEAEEEGEEE